LVQNEEISKNSRAQKLRGFPSHIREVQKTLIGDLGVKAEDFKSMAAAVKTLSDFYLKHPEKSTPWSESWTKIAYLSYYFPLNWWRASGVIGRGQQFNFFDGFEHYVDFGSGLGSVSGAFDAKGLSFKSGLCIERSNEAIALHQKLAERSLTPLSWTTQVEPAAIRPKTLAVFSYSATELESLPEWVEHCEGLMIIEPSTRDDSRKLQSLRAKLLSRGWHVWGPCTHSKECPLLMSGEKDWCHDRIIWTQPDWLKSVESFLPIKNGTLPCSWLMMRKTPLAAKPDGLARITGDLLEFKGYAKQLVCRGPAREFLSWQKKNFKTYPEIARGELVVLSDGIPMKGQELRVRESQDLQIMD